MDTNLQWGSGARIESPELQRSWPSASLDHMRSMTVGISLRLHTNCPARSLVGALRGVSVPVGGGSSFVSNVVIAAGRRSPQPFDHVEGCLSGIEGHPSNAAQVFLNNIEGYQNRHGERFDIDRGDTDCRRTRTE